MPTLNIEKFFKLEEILQKAICSICGNENKVVHGIDKISISEEKDKIETNFFYLNQIDQKKTLKSKKIKTEISSLPFIFSKCSNCFKVDFFCVDEILDK